MVKRRSFMTIVVIAISLSSFVLPAAYSESTDLPVLKDAPLPTNLIPSLATVKSDRPTPYRDRCHVQQNLVSTNSPCIYGDLTSNTNIVLFGDSHALSWFPAVEKLAFIKHWKLYSLTMSSCWPADIPAYNSTTDVLMENCPIWRKSALEQIAMLKPLITFVAGTRGFATVNTKGDVALDDERQSIWVDGISRTLAKLISASRKVIYIGDIPTSIFDVPKCLAINYKNYAACGTSYINATDDVWTALEEKVAKAAGAKFVDPTPWICKSDPCSPIDGNKEIYIDGGHLSATFALTLERPLWAATTNNS